MRKAGPRDDGAALGESDTIGVPVAEAAAVAAVVAAVIVAGGGDGDDEGVTPTHCRSASKSP